MSYDIFCYKSKLDKPDEDEAMTIIEADNDNWSKKEKHAFIKLAIVKVLTQYNPRLEAFNFDYVQIAKLTEEIINKAGKKFDHIELNPQEDDPAVRLTVYDNHVLITVPYWYQGEKARQLFKEIKDYIKVINDAAGYFVYDPQTGQVFDPAAHDFDGLGKYLSVSEHFDDLISRSKNQ